MDDALAKALALPARTVRPRKRHYTPLPVMAIANGSTLTEDGTIGSVVDLIGHFRNRPSTLFIKLSSADFVGELDKVFSVSDPNHWQWLAATLEHDIRRRSDRTKMATRVTTIIRYFGFKGGYYHKIIDPIAMYGHSLDSIWPGDDQQIVKLLKLAVSVRDFCDSNDLEVRPTAGSIGRQFLTDKRFYPAARRKVPAATNETCRQYMPGNHYMLLAQPEKMQEFTAHYLDQTRAHHYHAKTAALPDSNTLYAHGRFTDLAHCVFADTWPNFYGLYCLDLQAPAPPRNYYRWIRQFGILEKRFVYSNELSDLLDMGFRVTGVRAAWGSRHRDTGLNRYAQWANTQLDIHGDPAWLKPLLLSTYGTLASRPNYAEAVFRLAKKGEKVTLPTGHNKLNGLLVRSAHKLEPGIANVIHRGMIEAATRAESVGMAHHLDIHGHRVLSIYADAVIVEDDDTKKLPVIPDPWRIKRTLNHLQFIHQQAFISGEMTRLPGVSREILKYTQKSNPGIAPMRKVVTQYEAVTNREVQFEYRRI